MTNEEIVEQIQDGVNVLDNLELLYKQNIGFITKIVKPFSAYAEEEDLMMKKHTLDCIKLLKGLILPKGFCSLHMHHIKSGNSVEDTLIIMQEPTEFLFICWKKCVNIKSY